MNRLGAALLYLLASACSAERPNPESFFSEPVAVVLAGAACAGEADRVADLVADGASVDTRGAGNVTPLMFAVICKSPAGVKALLEAGANPNYRNRHGMTATWIAAGHANSEVLRSLLDAGGDMYAENDSCTDVLGRALILGIENHTSRRWDNYQLLLDRGIDVNHRDSCGGTIVQVASALGNFNKIAELLDRGYAYDLLSVAWSTEYIAVSEDRYADVERVKAMLRERGVRWPIPRVLDDAHRIAYMEVHPDYATRHPESWPDGARPTGE